jgi:putative transposase
VVIVEEDYTSVTCGSCGKYNEKLGGSKDFICPYCDYKADRDINASRNILLKYISDE